MCIDALTQVRAWLSLRERVLAMTEELRFHGSIQEVAVNRTGRTWFALFCVEDGQDPPPVKDGPIVGVDVGVGTMAVCSDGMKVANSNALGSALTELRRIDEAIARSRNVYGKSNPFQTAGAAVRQEETGSRPGRQRAERQPSQGDDDSQVGGLCGGRNPERVRDDWQPPAGAGDCQCGDVGLPDQAGVQVPLVRRRACKSATLVRVVKAVRALRLEE